MILQKEKASNIIWCILLFSILAFPRILQSVKIVLCLVLIVTNIIETKIIRIRKTTGAFWLLWMAYSLFTVISGIVQGNIAEGIYAFVRVNIFNLLLFIVLIFSVNNERSYELTIKTIIASTLYISIFNLIFIGTGYLGINISFLEKLDATARIGFHIGYTHLVTTNLSMSIMLFPLVVMLLNDSRINEMVNKKLHSITAVLCAVAMILSGRRILWISLLIGLAALYFYNTKSFKEKLKYLLIALVVIIFGIYVANRTGLISFEGLVSRFLYAFSSTDEYGMQNVRNIQSKYLIDGFLNKPIFGNGAGATLSGFQRSESSPWSFELSYHVVLFQSGIAGAIFYVAAIVLVFRRAIYVKRINNNVGTALVFTYISIIIANATNPYFSSSFDFMIFIFLPFLLSDLIVEYNDMSILL